jgi:hypothetical protein
MSSLARSLRASAASESSAIAAAILSRTSGSPPGAWEELGRPATLRPKAQRTCEGDTAVFYTSPAGWHARVLEYEQKKRSW